MLWQRISLDAEGKPRAAPLVRESLAAHFGDDAPCLVVLDNLPELTPLDARRVILDFLSAPGALGKTLVTIRDARTADGFAAVSLEVMTPDDGLRLLARYRTPNQARAEHDAMTALVNEVGAHTLALVLLGESVRDSASGYPVARIVAGAA